MGSASRGEGTHPGVSIRGRASASGGGVHPGGICIGGSSASKAGSVSRRHPGEFSRPSPSNTTGYSQRADGTHPSGMHSCREFNYCLH